MATPEQIEKEFRSAPNLKAMFDVLNKYFELENVIPSIFMKGIICNYLWTAVKNLKAKQRSNV